MPTHPHQKFSSYRRDLFWESRNLNLISKLGLTSSWVFVFPSVTWRVSTLNPYAESYTPRPKERSTVAIKIRGLRWQMLLSLRAMELRNSSPLMIQS
ncbi:hypothetical protein Nepgr_014278 [Nepenthes gracilis]|uniref:Uncharacterized protein n=1 Tax=Nepenthes gracilis TaxID=150966 RepID=A0AAD3SKX9_NEPGR|nr:hypothetical protein Nepgr_014278 [Nepenthes gracilis]